MVSDWKTKAEAKRKAILDSIPSKWRIDKVPSREEQKDVTEYIHQFLDKKEIEITETDAVGIAEKVASGGWTAVEVTEAFCHRASLAHQLVRSCSHSRNMTQAATGQLSS
jgi:amidase